MVMHSAQPGLLGISSLHVPLHGYWVRCVTTLLPLRCSLASIVAKIYFYLESVAI